MGIRAFMALLRFALLCTDLLAWPAIALGYPLFASIRAVETGSKYHMKKLVIYWTLFSLFSLFEFAFAKIIDWLPLWSSIKLVVIFWLVMPRFDGACCAYEDLVRPILVVKVQEVIDRFNQWKEEGICRRGTCLDVVEKYIKENGPEALDKLALELNVPQAAQCDTEILEAAEKSAAATMAHQVLCAESSSVNPTDGPTNDKEMIPLEASADIRCPNLPPIMETQQEWTCNLCKVTTMSESVLNAHLQGRKHKSKLESLKANMLGAKNQKQSLSGAEVKESIPSKETAEKRFQEMPHLKKAQQVWTCDLCNVTATGKRTYRSHLYGSKHKAKLETMKSSKLGAQVTGPSNAATSKLNCGNASDKFIGESGSELEKTNMSKVLIEAKETTPPEASAENIHAETPPLKRPYKEYTCQLCKVKTSSENNLNDHFMGSKHKAKLDSLNFIEFRAKDTGLSPWKVHKDGVVKETEISNQYWCVVCNVKLSSDVDLAAHLKGKRHSFNIEASIA